jgi:hypothetical protein
MKKLSTFRKFVALFAVLVIALSPTLMFFMDIDRNVESAMHLVVLVAIVVGITLAPLLSVVGWVLYARSSLLRDLVTAVLPTLWSSYCIWQVSKMPYW